MICFLPLLKKTRFLKHAFGQPSCWPGKKLRVFFKTDFGLFKAKFVWTKKHSFVGLRGKKSCFVFFWQKNTKKDTNSALGVPAYLTSWPTTKAV